MRIGLVVLFTALSTVSHAQSSAWDRNDMFGNYYKCSSESVVEMTLDKAAGKWQPQKLPQKRNYNIDVVSVAPEDPRLLAIASQYRVKSWNKGEESRSCLQLWNTTAHEYNTVTIERNGQLDCSMEGDGGAVEQWSINLKTGRYVRTRDDGFIKGEDGLVAGPQLEIGYCKAQ
ncbi:hypothetical protein ASF91_13295 [Rhizobium sp. Leaf155]|nr:hypothetical protein ASF91_13295 [Rhizobium sp. Leaf155]